MAEPRRTFGPVVLLAGLAAGALATAGTQTWFRPEGEGVVDCEAPCVGLSYGEAGVAWSFGLVMLACLGVTVVALLLLRSEGNKAVNAMFSDPSQIPDLILTVAIRLVSVVSIATIVIVAADLV